MKKVGKTIFNGELLDGLQKICFPITTYVWNGSFYHHTERYFGLDTNVYWDKTVGDMTFQFPGSDAHGGSRCSIWPWQVQYKP